MHELRKLPQWWNIALSLWLHIWYRLSNFRTLKIGKCCNLSINMICACVCQHCPSLPLRLMVWMWFYSYYNVLKIDGYNLCINISSWQRSGMWRKPKNFFFLNKTCFDMKFTSRRYYLYSEEVNSHRKVMNKDLICSFFWVTMHRHLRCMWSKAMALDSPSIPLESCSIWAGSNFSL